MDISDWLAEQFEGERSRLLAMAYRMLGSLPEAEDAVQETWLRLSRADRGDVSNLSGWLTTVAARVCLTHLHERKTRPEEPLEADVSAPITSREGEIDPEEEAEMAESVGLALLVVLDTLSPAERLAFVLHDIFAVPFEEIAPLVERSETATRQLASRARRRVRGVPRETSADVAASREVVEAFLAASREGDFDALLSVLDPEVVVRADHVAVSRGAESEIRGAQDVARVARHRLGRIQIAQLVLVDGAVGLIVAPRGWLRLLLRFTIKGGKIVAIDEITDPAHLHRLRLALIDDQ